MAQLVKRRKPMDVTRCVDAKCCLKEINLSFYLKSGIRSMERATSKFRKYPVNKGLASKSKYNVLLRNLRRQYG